MSRSTVLAFVTVLVAVACGADDEVTSNSSFAVTPPSTSASTTTAATVVPAPVASPTDAPTTTTIGPLADPSVTLFEIGTFDQPVEVAHRPGDARLYVVEQPGRVRAVDEVSDDVVLDITDLTDASGEQGLLGLAFHPTDPLAYVYFTDNDGDTVVAEFGVDGTGRLDRDAFREVLTVEQPYANHNGGELAFGPDQLLYIGLGDGGSGGDPQRYALNLGSRLGKILRIDPRTAGDQPFSVPADNPFLRDASADPAIWSYGLRNPWRFSFDAETGDLWIADVGQGDFEEINRAPAVDRADAGRAANFGWSAFEGFERFNADQPADGAVAPVFVYDHSDGRCSVSGGAVARPTAASALAGWYVFGDYCSGEIWALDPASPVEAPRVVEIASLPGLAVIAEGPRRELYAVSNAGVIARLDP
jgi:glucose/arabinose dehydrogenase